MNKNFGESAVNKYQPFNNEVTQSLFMGFNGIDKGIKQEAGTVVLDLLLKGGTMLEDEDHRWTMDDGAEQD